MKKYILFLFSIALFSCKNEKNKTTTFQENQTTATTLVEKGVAVENTKMAIEIAEKEWLAIYGKKVLDEKPYHAALVCDTVWIVDGTLSPNHIGGTAHIEIRKRDSKILNITHSK